MLAHRMYGKVCLMKFGNRSSNVLPFFKICFGFILAMTCAKRRVGLYEQEINNPRHSYVIDFSQFRVQEVI